MNQKHSYPFSRSPGNKADVTLTNCMHTISVYITYIQFLTVSSMEYQTGFAIDGHSAGNFSRLQLIYVKVDFHSG